MTSDPPDPDAIVDLLGLEPHPEGGWYRQTWRHEPAGGGRGAGTAIYFLLRPGERSHWHRVDAAEVWHHYLGAEVRLSIAPGADDAAGARRVEHRRLGPDLLGGARPQHVVPAGWWQAAEPVDGWALVGCTVSPAFVLDGFELAPPGWSPGAALPG